MKHRDTAQERDERIVAEAGPWSWSVGILAPDSDAWIDMDDNQSGNLMRAAARILNRIVRARRRRER